jgi:small ligand-binding sensory domain FIST
MTSFASSLSRHPVPEDAVAGAAAEVLDAMGGEDPDLVVWFASPHFVGAFDDMAAVLRDVLGPRVFVGMTAVSIVADGSEVEDGPAVSVLAAQLPGARATAVSLEVEDTPDGPAIVGWPELGDEPSTLVLLADPFTFPVSGFLERVNQDRPGLRVIGGAASAAVRPGGNRLAVDDRVMSSGAVGVLIDGADVRTVVSQGCRPVGEPFVATSADRNIVHELGGQPALARLQECAARASEEDRALMRTGLHVGLVVDERKAEFDRGDFLVRNLVGVDERSGAIGVAEVVSVGQTVQFHVRDPAAADEDLRHLLDGAQATAALLFTCNGRGQRFFGVPDHDAGLVEEVLGPLPVAGAFCAGEIGPVGGRNFLHGFTASLALL